MKEVVIFSSITLMVYEGGSRSHSIILVGYEGGGRSLSIIIVVYEGDGHNSIILVVYECLLFCFWMTSIGVTIRGDDDADEDYDDNYGVDDDDADY